MGNELPNILISPQFHGKKRCRYFYTNRRTLFKCRPNFVFLIFLNVRAIIKRKGVQAILPEDSNNAQRKTNAVTIKLILRLLT